MTTRLTPEQKAARAQLAEARKRTQEKKLRDRRLYQVGEVMEAHGYTDPAETVLVAACAVALLGPSMWELSRRWRGGGAGWTR